MISVSLEWIAEQVNGTLFGESTTLCGVSTDTRQITQGDLFIALVGPNFDGHKFVDVAAQQGASALLVSTKADSHLPQILVEDTKLALGQLGAAVKATLAPKTVGITGSSGKTTVKEMVASILGRRGNVLATQGNFNNDIGVPLTLLRLTPEHEYAVIEMGANHLGEIAYTTSLVKPDVATIVNAAASHLEGFGSLLGVARAKSEIFKGLQASGTAVLNADSQFYKFWEGKLRHANVLTFSLEGNADFHAQDVTLGLDGCANFDLLTSQGRVPVSLPLPGMHNVGNALVSAALAMQVGATLEDIRDGLQTMQQVGGRLNVKQLTNQIKLLDDSYNANVASVKAAIELLASFSGLRVLVLGDMAELGEKSRDYHQQVGEFAKQKGIDMLLSVGVLSQFASHEFEQSGGHFEDKQTLVDSLCERVVGEQRDITILVKGSRSSKMDEVVNMLEASPLGKFERSRERIAC
ncbi:UDP-N-acetylmuramoyl-tripeptide--D-alanyl-D-alanine ligase [Aestuariibacter salexigens]|uniref:UDP-N-acetylmuramoyl-tripeptide--D-alanyl-D- alanine ligase n=1 Tax=Aestuariibacter salexigens TaxID=226010 RepID=UPI00041FD548|nr:UDP-N-acetylmuramoyl-tripeptide--D-alanyl-D-alanine ligase [Aestuariibacter salexigens]